MSKFVWLISLVVMIECPVYAEGIFFWTVQGKAEIYRADLNSREVEALQIKGGGYPLGLAVDDQANQLYFGWEDRDQLRALTNKVSVGNPPERFYPREINLKSLVDYGKIIRASFDLTDMETVFSTGESTISLDVDSYISGGDEAPTSIALDLERKRIYWSEFNGFRIRRCNLDGTGVETLVEKGNCGQPRFITLDIRTEKMSWTIVRDEIRQADLDGSSGKVLSTGESPSGIAVDPDAQKVYWTDVKRILQADLDGANQVELPIKGWDGWGGAIALDTQRHEIYWADTDGKRILRAELDQLEAEVVIPSAAGHVRSIALASVPDR